MVDGDIKTNILLMNQIKESNSEEPNHRVLSGLAEARIGDIEEYITTFLKELFCGGKDKLKFVKLELCSPYEALLTMPKATVAKFEISVSNIALYKVLLSYNGEETKTKHIYLLFCTQGGVVRLSGSIYALSSVLSDKAISPNNNSVFIRLFKGKILVKKILYDVSIGGKIKTHPFISANIYKTKKSALSASTVNATGIMIYLLCKYGYTETMLDLLGFVPELTLDPSHDDDYVIYKSAVMAANKNNKLRITSPVIFRVPATEVDVDVVGHERVNYINMVLCNMISTVDHFHSEDVTIDDFDDCNVWITLLGYVIFPNTTPAEYVNSVITHLNSLDGYVNKFMRRELIIEFGDTLGEDFKVDGFYRLLSVVMKNYLPWQAAADEITGTVVDKRYRLLYFLLFSMIQMFNTLAFRVDQLTPDRRNIKQINRLLDEKIRPKTIYGIRQGNQGCTIVNYSGDHAHFKLSSNVALQASIDTNGGSKGRIDNPTTVLYETQSLAGTHNAISMTRLSPLVRINPYVTLKEGTTKIILEEDRKRDLEILSWILKESPKRSSKPEIPSAYRVL